MIGTIEGRYGDTGNCPYVDALIHLPRLRVNGHISFIFDTGCDQTLLMPQDGIRMGLDFDNLESGRSSLSAGGEMETFEERAVLLFQDIAKKYFAYDIIIAIAAPDGDNEEIPSLLGRDIISNWRCIIDLSKKTLSCDVLSADLVTDQTKKS